MRYKLVALQNAIEGRDDDFNTWLNDTHVPDSLRVPGIVSAQRFQLTKAQREGASRQWKYMTLLDVETDDLTAVIGELKRRIGTPEMIGTDAIAGGSWIHFFEPVGEFLRLPL